MFIEQQEPLKRQHILTGSNVDNSSNVDSTCSEEGEVSTNNEKTESLIQKHQIKNRKSKFTQNELINRNYTTETNSDLKENNFEKHFLPKLNCHKRSFSGGSSSNGLCVFNLKLAVSNCGSSVKGVSGAVREHHTKKEIKPEHANKTCKKVSNTGNKRRSEGPSIISERNIFSKTKKENKKETNKNTVPPNIKSEFVRKTGINATKNCLDYKTTSGTSEHLCSCDNSLISRNLNLVSNNMFNLNNLSNTTGYYVPPYNHFTTYLPQSSQQEQHQQNVKSQSTVCHNNKHKKSSADVKRSKSLSGSVNLSLVGNKDKLQKCGK